MAPGLRPHLLLPLFGHTELRSDLLGSFQRRTLPQSVLLHGPAGIGKQRLALWLAQTLVCEAPTAEGPCGTCRHCRRYLREMKLAARTLGRLPRVEIPDRTMDALMEQFRSW